MRARAHWRVGYRCTVVQVISDFSEEGLQTFIARHPSGAIVHCDELRSLTGPMQKGRYGSSGDGITSLLVSAYDQVWIRYYSSTN